MSPLLKNIIRILFYGIVYYILEQFLTTGAAIKSITLSYAQPFLVFISVIQGPLVGGFAFALGIFLLQFSVHTYDWLLIACAFLNCASIGYFMKSVDIRNGFFSRKDVLRFNGVQLISNFLVWCLIYPLATHFLLNVDLPGEIKTGFQKAFGYFISNLVIGTIFLALYSRSRITEANFYRH